MALPRPAPGTLNLTPSGVGANDYSGVTTIQAGALRVIESSQIGNGTSAVNLSGGQLEYNGSGAVNAKLFNVTNPVHVTANSTIAYNSVTGGLTNVTDPTGIQFVFSNNTFDRSGGTLTLVHQGASQGITYRPRFSGSGFNYAGPVVISNGGGTRKTVLESTNTTGTQTWSAISPVMAATAAAQGGNTVFAGQLVSVGGVTIADNSKIQLAQSPGSNRVIRTANLTIGSTNSQLDLTNNKLIVPGGNVGTFSGGAYSGVSGLIASSYDFGAWDLPGITTSMPDAGPTVGTTTIGVSDGASVLFLGPTETGMFAGQTITGSSVIAMYTYAGDVNLRRARRCFGLRHHRQLLPVPRHERLRQRRLQLRRHYRRRRLRHHRQHLPTARSADSHQCADAVRCQRRAGADGGHRDAGGAACRAVASSSSNHSYTGRNSEMRIFVATPKSYD
jgi:autotransporter-associated beta strand protein